MPLSMILINHSFGTPSIVRGAVFESIVPEAKNMTDEEAAALLRLALTSEPAREYLKKRAEGATS